MAVAPETAQGLPNAIEKEPPLRAVAIALLISSAVACAGAAQAQAGVSGDARCALTMAALASNKANQPQATLGLFYFVGRIKAESPGFNFATGLKPVADRMTPADYQAETKRCGAMVQEAVQSLEAAQTSLNGPKPAAAAPPPAKK